MQDEKGITITNAFQTFLDESNSKPNRMWVDKGSEFYNRSMESWLQDNDIERNSAHNQGKSVFAERYVRILKNKMYMHVDNKKKDVLVPGEVQQQD